MYIAITDLIRYGHCICIFAFIISMCCWAVRVVGWYCNSLISTQSNSGYLIVMVVLIDKKRQSETGKTTPDVFYVADVTGTVTTHHVAIIHP